jgi:anti-sigma regulatory factor (Ser/Thr protein kinase)
VTLQGAVVHRGNGSADQSDTHRQAVVDEFLDGRSGHTAIVAYTPFDGQPGVMRLLMLAPLDLMNGGRRGRTTRRKRVFFGQSPPRSLARFVQRPVDRPRGQLMSRPEANEYAPRPEFTHRTWPADPTQLTLIRAEVRRWLAPQRLTDQAQEDIVLAVSEAATNAVEHAYPPDSPNPTVELTFWTDAHAVSIEVADHGSWRPVPDEPAGRGLGIVLMQRLMQSVVIRYNAQGTRVLLTHSLPGDARDLPREVGRPTLRQAPSTPERSRNRRLRTEPPERR